MLKLQFGKNSLSFQHLKAVSLSFLLSICIVSILPNSPRTVPCSWLTTLR